MARRFTKPALLITISTLVVISLLPIIHNEKLTSQNQSGVPKDIPEHNLPLSQFPNNKANTTAGRHHEAINHRDQFPIGTGNFDYDPFNYSQTDSNNTTKMTIPTNHPHAGALDQWGRPHYVADPTALRRSLFPLLLEDLKSTHLDDPYWNVWQTFAATARQGTMTQDYEFVPRAVCQSGPGQSWEGEAGFKLLMQKIRIWKNNGTNINEEEGRRPRLLCSIYTYPKMRDLARIQALTWGHKCDGFLAFSTETIPELGFVHILHKGEEAYQNMWQKVRSIWAYIAMHYLHDYDFFHLGGDDLYLIVENMKIYLATLQRKSEEPLFMGSWIGQPGKERIFVAGAPGYTLNRVALKRFAEEALETCSPDHKVSHEDRLISKCLWGMRIHPQDTRDVQTGEGRYHDCSPEHLYTFRTSPWPRRPSFHTKAAAHWERLPHPLYPNQTTGPKHGLEAAARYSIALHDIFHPLYVLRIHALLFPKTCPADSVLGRGLRFYGILK